MLGERQSVTAEDLEKMVYLEQVVLACFLYTIILNAHTKGNVKVDGEAWKLLNTNQHIGFGTIYSIVSWTTPQPTSGFSGDNETVSACFRHHEGGSRGFDTEWL